MIFLKKLLTGFKVNQPTKKVDIDTCPVCHGTKFFTLLGHPSISMGNTCPICKGSGKLRRKVPIEHGCHSCSGYGLHIIFSFGFVSSEKCKSCYGSGVDVMLPNEITVQYGFTKNVCSDCAGAGYPPLFGILEDCYRCDSRGWLPQYNLNFLN